MKRGRTPFPKGLEGGRPFSFLATVVHATGGMARRPRRLPGGFVFHVFNRSARKLTLFESPSEYWDFLAVLAEAQERVPMRLVSYCVMPNHWHLVAWPAADGELSRFMAWLTTTHAVRWRQRRDAVGQGVVYQGRFKAVPVQRDGHFLSLCRYVERNPVRAGLVTRAEQWPWSSANPGAPDELRPALSPWPVERPADWRERVNTPEPEEITEALRSSLIRGRPWGSSDWQAEVTRTQGVAWPRRPVGRPRPAHKMGYDPF
jgi:putative transposase